MDSLATLCRAIPAAGAQDPAWDREAAGRAVVAEREGGCWRTDRRPRAKSRGRWLHASAVFGLAGWRTFWPWPLDLEALELLAVVWPLGAQIASWGCLACWILISAGLTSVGAAAIGAAAGLMRPAAGRSDFQGKCCGAAR